VDGKIPYDQVCETFKHPKVRAVFLYAACMWGLDPTETGAFLFPLMINRAMHKQQCYGGSHKLASLFGKDVIMSGGLILENAEVVKINVDGGKVSGVELWDGTQVKCKAVASTLDPQTTFVKLVGEKNIPATLTERCNSWKPDKWSLWTMHIATEKPLVYDVEEPGINQSLMNIMGFENEDDVMKFFTSVRAGKLDHIGGHATCETLYDPTLVDIPGHHVSKFQFRPPTTWTAKRELGEEEKGHRTQGAGAVAQPPEGLHQEGHPHSFQRVAGGHREKDPLHGAGRDKAWRLQYSADGQQPPGPVVLQHQDARSRPVCLRGLDLSRRDGHRRACLYCQRRHGAGPGSQEVVEDTGFRHQVRRYVHQGLSL